MSRRALLAASESAMCWLTATLPTAAQPSAVQPAEKNIADAAIVLEVVSRTAPFRDVARTLLLMLWEQPATGRALHEALSRDHASRLRGLLAFSAFVRSGIIQRRVLEDLLAVEQPSCPVSLVDSFAMAYCRRAIPSLDEVSNIAVADYQRAADVLLPLPIVPSIDVAYLFTHAIFYVTDFGSLTAVVPQHDVDHISTRMPRWIEHFFSLPEFDVYAELTTVAAILGLPASADWASSLCSAQLPNGILPGSPCDDDGFHATLVALMAWVASLARIDALPGAAQPGNASDGASRRG